MLTAQVAPRRHHHRRGGPPNKKKRATKAASQSSVVSIHEEAPASSSMSYPPRYKSRSGSNQLEPISINCLESSEQVQVPPAALVQKKAKRKRKDLAKESSKHSIISLDSPTMGIRSKKPIPASSAMSTRSKRRLSL
ncbi:hypothetical protein BAE44_0010499 [Dichanthelium oligosanthes]|uniref:Uncharacterized protein n=1 Tax=Dichanthelium oligosanthes TaxID=888268 RepID=A0A1E5VTN8_9POAL|nr:hypothetical protein BAE44_0010499 [Dichanthelium oligosanthes]